MKLRTAVRSVLVALVFVAGCGDDGAADATSTGGGSTPLPNACTLVSDGAVAELLGGSAPGQHMTAGSGALALDRCNWEVTDPVTLTEHSLKLSIAGAAAYQGESGLIPSEPYAIGEEGRLQTLNRKVELIWKRGDYSASLAFAILGGFDGDFAVLEAQVLDIAADVDAAL